MEVLVRTVMRQLHKIAIFYSDIVSHTHMNVQQVGCKMVQQILQWHLQNFITQQSIIHCFWELAKNDKKLPIPQVQTMIYMYIYKFWKSPITYGNSASNCCIITTQASRSSLTTLAAAAFASLLQHLHHGFGLRCFKAHWSEVGRAQGVCPVVTLDSGTVVL